MNTNLPPSNSNQNRLYTRLITTLKILQFIGYFLVVVYLIVVCSMFGLTLGAIGVGFFSIALLGSLIPVVFGCMIVYIFIATLIAIIDLLSRIERNTRSE